MLANKNTYDLPKNDSRFSIRFDRIKIQLSTVQTTLAEEDVDKNFSNIENQSKIHKKCQRFKIL